MTAITSIPVTDMDDTISPRVPAWGQLPKIGDAENCVFMVNHVRVVDGAPDPKGVDRFVEQLQRVLATDHFNGKLSPIISMPLAKIADYDRIMLAAYIRSPKTREQLNEIFGEELFVLEGTIGKEL